MRYLVPVAVLCALLFVIDYYVYRTWRLFANERPYWRWTISIYRVMMALMPFSLPVYLTQFNWWEVEPRLARALFFGFWSVYYVPKVTIGLVLLVKDSLRGVAALVQRARPPRDVQSPQITRSEFIRQAGWVAAAVPFIGAGYGVFRTLYDFTVYRVDVPIAGLPRALDGITIAQISDLHAGSLLHDKAMRDAVAQVNALKPHLIAVTGDFVNDDSAEMLRVLPALRDLKAELGVYGCLGNHDHYAQTDRLVEEIRTTPIDLLINEHRTFSIDGANLHLIGTDNTGLRQNFGDLPRAMEGIEQDGNSALVLLAHDPTFWDDHVRPNAGEIDLMLCGHTHGGQFGIEVGPLRWGLAKIRYDRWAGLYEEPREGGTQFLYVNRGIGTVGPPLRLGIPPEITLITLRRG